MLITNVSYPPLMMSSKSDHCKQSEDKSSSTSRRVAEKEQDGTEWEEFHDLFPYRLHQLLSEVEREGVTHVISWLPCGTLFRVHNIQKFEADVMPRIGRFTRYKSFLRQLSMYKFERITSGPLKGAYRHPYFRKDHIDLCRGVLRGELYLKKDQPLISSTAKSKQGPHLMKKPPPSPSITKKPAVAANAMAAGSSIHDSITSTSSSSRQEETAMMNTTGPAVLPSSSGQQERKNFPIDSDTSTISASDNIAGGRAASSFGHTFLDFTTALRQQGSHHPIHGNLLGVNSPSSPPALPQQAQQQLPPLERPPPYSAMIRIDQQRNQFIPHQKVAGNAGVVGSSILDSSLPPNLFAFDQQQVQEEQKQQNKINPRTGTSPQGRIGGNMVTCPNPQIPSGVMPPGSPPAAAASNSTLAFCGRSFQPTSSSSGRKDDTATSISHHHHPGDGKNANLVGRQSASSSSTTTNNHPSRDDIVDEIINTFNNGRRRRGRGSSSSRSHSDDEF